MKILLVEDDQIMAEIVEECLVEQHYLVEKAADGLAGLALAEAVSYDLILLDLVLPKLDGIKCCQKLRRRGDRTPILLMTATNVSTDKIAGLDAGADDYLVKPFDLQELLARIRALLRRGPDLLQPELEWGNLRLNPNSCQVSYNDEKLRLTAKEYKILEIFLRNPERIFSQSALLDRLWSFEEAPSENTVRTHIKSLRHKLKKAGAALDPIETIYGLGYRLKTWTGNKRQTEETSTDKGGKVGQTNVLLANVNPGELDNRLQSPNPITTETKTELVSDLSSAERIMAIWERHKQKYLDRLSMIEQAVASMDRDGVWSDRQRQQAQYQAHTLTAIGSFGWETASEKCREIESIFETHPISPLMKERLSQLLLELRRELELNPVSVEPRETLAARGFEKDFKLSLTKPYPLKQTKQANSEERPTRLLIVDDDSSLAQMLCAEATIWGMEAEIAISIEGAKDLITRQVPDVVLLDLCFPESVESGLELLGELSAREPPVPVVVCTAKAHLAERVKVARLGGQGFIHKPMSPVRVMEAISKAIEKTTNPGAKLLAVDDDSRILRHLEEELSPWGFQMTLLEEPQEFWQHLERSVPDLLILDVEMPDISGIDLCAVVRNDPRWYELPILCLSERADAETIHGVFSAGADDYIQKPFIGPELVARVLNRIERSQLRRKLTAVRNQLF